MSRPLHALTTPCLKTAPPFACYNFDTPEPILLIYGRDVVVITVNTDCEITSTLQQTACGSGKSRLCG